MRTLFLYAGLILATLMLLAGCSSGNSGSDGRVKLVLADAPLHLDDGSVVSAVNVTFTRVELIAGDESGLANVTLFDGSETVNLLELANTPLPELVQLSLTSVPAGIYEQVRFIVDPDASEVVVDGVPQPLFIPSGAQTGLKIPIQLSVAPGTTQVLLLDFDLTRLHQKDQFLLTPNAVRAVSMDNAGTVTGTAAVADGITLAADQPVTLTLIPAGSTAALATTQVVLTAAAPSAPFVINGVPAGTYTVKATAPEGEGTFTLTTPEFTVDAGATVDLGTLAIGTPPAPELTPEE